MEPLHPRDPHRIGPYRLLSRLGSGSGSGSTGQAYLARSDRGRTVAVKLVRRSLAAREEFRARLGRDIAAARRVGGEWTVPFLDADTEAEALWLATGYVAGPSVHEVVAHGFGPLPGRSVRVLAAGLAYALQDLHGAGLVHHGLKSSNVLLTLHGPRVLDFGIARALADPAGDRPERAGGAGAPGRDGEGGATGTSRTDVPRTDMSRLDASRLDVSRTDMSRPGGRTHPERGGAPTGPGRAGMSGAPDRTGTPTGASGFIAPEQVRGEAVTGACDVFRLGVVLSYAVTGRLPFGDPGQPGGSAALLRRVTEAEPSLDDVPADLRALVRDCLRKEPATRPGPDEILARVGANTARATGTGAGPVAGRAGGGGGPGGGEGPAAGAADAGRAVEPWLPMLLVAQIGRHTVQLLDREDAGPDRVPAPGRSGNGNGNGSRTGDRGEGGGGIRSRGGIGGGSGSGGGSGDRLPGTARGASVPAHSPYPEYAPLEEEPPQRARTASTAFLLVVAVVVAIAAGGSVYAVMSGKGHPLPPGKSPRTPNTAPATTTGSDDRGDAGRTRSTTGPGAGNGSGTGKRGKDTPGAGDGPEAGVSSGTGTGARNGTGNQTGNGTGTGGESGTAGRLPQAYVGTWRATAGAQVWQLVLTPGAVGDQVMSLSVHDPGFACTWKAPLHTAAEPVELGASTVTSTITSGTPHACAPGARSLLRLLPDGTLQRELTGASHPSLSYHRQ